MPDPVSSPLSPKMPYLISRTGPIWPTNGYLKIFLFAFILFERQRKSEPPSVGLLAGYLQQLRASQAKNKTLGLYPGLHICDRDSVVC